MENGLTTEATTEKQQTESIEMGSKDKGKETKVKAKSVKVRTSTPKTAPAKLAKLPKPDAKSVQETFRCTPAEHNEFVAKAQKAGAGSMSDFFRAGLGLDV